MEKERPGESREIPYDSSPEPTTLACFPVGDARKEDLMHGMNYQIRAVYRSSLELDEKLCALDSHSLWQIRLFHCTEKSQPPA